MTITEQRQLVEAAERKAGSVTLLADHIGVRPSTVYRWLNGTRKMHGMAIRTVEGYLAERGGSNVQ